MNETDLMVSDDYDFIQWDSPNRSGNNSFIFSTKEELMEQILMNRIQININEFEINSVLGANLSIELGNVIDEYLLNRIRDRIIEVLTIDNFLSIEDFVLNLVVKNNTEILISLILQNTGVVTITENNRKKMFIFTYSITENKISNNT